MSDHVLKTHWGTEYVPLPTQERFHRSDAKYRFYCGYIGSGKSLCGSVECLLDAIAVPGHRPGRTVIARDTQTNLVQTTWNTFSRMVEETCPNLIAKKTNSTHTISMTLKNGWEFTGAHMSNYENFGSLELDAFYLDEANDAGVGLEAYNMLCGRLRGKVGSRRGWCSGNPGGRNWAFERFFQHKLEGTKPFRDHEGFQPGPLENKYLPEGYLEDLREFYPEEWIAKFLDGDFSVYEGQIVNELNAETHYIDAFPIPQEWPRYRGLDHGWTHPTACVWVATDYDGNHYVYREYVKSEAVPATNAERIMALSAGEEAMVQWTAIDPSARQTQTAGGSAARIIDQYRDAGLMGIRLADNDIKASIALIKRLLQPDPERIFPRWHWRAGDAGAPRLFISRDCRILFNQLQGWQWKAVRPGGVDRETPLAKNDDSVAALRYLLMEMPRAPKITSARQYDWLEAALAERDSRRGGLETFRIGA